MMRTISTRRLVLMAILTVIGTTKLHADNLLSSAEETNREKDQADALAAERFELMKNGIRNLKAESADKGFPEHFELKPLFRYNDPARGYVAAAVWKLGEQGRPRALVTTELHRRIMGSPRLVYELLSLNSTRFTVTSNDLQWTPGGTAFEFKPILGADAPEKTPQRRTLQMRSIAKRFSGYEILSEGKSTLRLLPQPIDRYAPSHVENADGALFVLTFGTNPEIALLIESDGKTWNYAAGRLSGARDLVLTIDDATAWEAPPLKYGVNESYTAASAKTDIPGLAVDGSEIKK